MPEEADWLALRKRYCRACSCRVKKKVYNFFMDKLEITSASDFAVELTKLYKTGMPPGFPTGWESLNDFYTVLPGQFTLITGVPSHGKSTWLDCLTVNLAWMGWHFAVYTPEQEPPEVHMATLCEKVLHKPFRTGYNGCMEPSDIAEAVAFIDEHYRFLRIPKESNDVPTIADIVESAHTAFDGWEKSNPGGQYGIIVDPWNELLHTFTSGDTETKYIGETLGFFRRVCRNWGTHGWIVAHPKQLIKNPKTGEYPIPKAYDISGSAHWYNKADNIITVWRSELDTDDVEIHIQKVRFRHVGKRGLVHLSFNCADGTYADFVQHWATPPADHRAKAAGE